jgi:hypothetical protein
VIKSLRDIETENIILLTLICRHSFVHAQNWNFSWCSLVLPTRRLVETEAEMYRILQIPLLLSLLCLPAKAQAQTLVVGRGVVCDTAEQMERFIGLRGNGKDAVVAQQTVNEEAQIVACNVALIMFTGGEPVVELTIRFGVEENAGNYSVHRHGERHGDLRSLVPGLPRCSSSGSFALVVRNPASPDQLPKRPSTRGL